MEEIEKIPEIPNSFLDKIFLPDFFCATIFTAKSSSKNWAYAYMLAQKADAVYEEGCAVCSLWKLNKQSMTYAHIIITCAKDWKNFILFVGGEFCKSWKQNAWFDCFVRSYDAQNIFAFCTTIDKISVYSSSNVYRYSIDIISPCKQIGGMWGIGKRKDVPIIDQIQAKAARHGLARCPRFDMSNCAVYEP